MTLPRFFPAEFSRNKLRQIINEQLLDYIQIYELSKLKILSE